MRNRRVAVTAVLDAAFVLLFAAVGRSSHDEGTPVLGTLSVAWPFLVGAACGWALVRWRSGGWPLAWPRGIPVVVCTVVVGMVLRVLTGPGTALTFILVATAILTLMLVGWRVVADLVFPRMGARGRTSRQT